MTNQNDPTPEEIRSACDAIRATETSEQLKQRIVKPGFLVSIDRLSPNFISNTMIGLVLPNNLDM